MMNTARYLLALGLVALPACVEQSASRPTPEQVIPASGLLGHATSIRIVGRGFRPLVRANYDDEDRAVVSDRFTARLGQHALSLVVYVNSGELTAEVPATLPAGTHDLTVVDNKLYSSDISQIKKSAEYYKKMEIRRESRRERAR